PSRHEIPDLALIQVARIAIAYRSNPPPRLEKLTRLLTPEQLETAMSDPFERPTFDQFVLDERDSAELEHLAALSAEYPGEAPGVALLDGTLIRWNLEAREPGWKALQLGRLREAFGRLRESGTPVVGYISRPGSRDVIHALAIYHYYHLHGRAPREPAEVLQANKESSEAGRFGLEITDRLLFDRLLAPGQRSGWFASGSYVLRGYAPEDRILFCYLKTDSEVVRLEIPAWAEPYSETMHSLVLDQCRKGRGYPITLSEAHEQAVIRGPDRDLFYRLASEEWMRLRRESGARSPLPRPSPKQERKRRPVF
ncbi:MAG TPA: DNA double-strand break repair nuclease NurA, partial [Firmicutes bacterium]|nr:DNA double-strand break repair nuclease NurA [Bacillota bacterium]